MRFLYFILIINCVSSLFCLSNKKENSPIPIKSENNIKASIITDIELEVKKLFEENAKEVKTILMGSTVVIFANVNDKTFPIENLSKCVERTSEIINKYNKILMIIPLAVNFSTQNTEMEKKIISELIHNKTRGKDFELLVFKNKIYFMGNENNHLLIENIKALYPTYIIYE